VSNVSVSFACSVANLIKLLFFANEEFFCFSLLSGVILLSMIFLTFCNKHPSLAAKVGK